MRRGRVPLFDDPSDPALSSHDATVPVRPIENRREHGRGSVGFFVGGDESSECFARQGHAVVALMDPVYPVYVDSNVMGGRYGEADPSGRYAGFVYMPCTAENRLRAVMPSSSGLRPGNSAASGW